MQTACFIVELPAYLKLLTLSSSAAVVLAHARFFFASVRSFVCSSHASLRQRTVTPAALFRPCHPTAKRWGISPTSPKRSNCAAIVCLARGSPYFEVMSARAKQENSERRGVAPILIWRLQQPFVACFLRQVELDTVRFTCLKP